MQNITPGSTTDYSIFKLLPANRNINKAHAKKLARTLTTNPKLSYLSPITVNEKMEVIDGQHRLEAHKLLGEQGTTYPLYFIVREGFSITEAQAINSGTKAWQPKDYAKAYCNEISDYATYLQFATQPLAFNHDVLVRFLAKDYSMDTFKQGGFRINDLTQSKKWFSQLEDVGELIDDEGHLNETFWKHRSFAFALLNLMRTEYYDHDTMLEQLEDNSEKLKNTEMKNKSIEKSLLKIYNKNNPHKINLE